MALHSEAAFVLTILVFCYAVFSGLVRRWYLAPALIFVVLGMVVGPSGLGVLDRSSPWPGGVLGCDLGVCGLAVGCTAYM